jgi:hypothetical protein
VCHAQYETENIFDDDVFLGEIGRVIDQGVMISLTDRYESISNRRL